MSEDTTTLLTKYHDIIAEEVNVKQVTLLDQSINITTTYAPIGSALSAKFGKDTGKIIAAAKQGNVKAGDNGKIVVTQGDESWTLEAGEYEVRYSGLTGDHQTVEEGAIVELDLTITEELKAEGVAREISRFLNQMRKDADYAVDDRVACWYETKNEYIATIIEQFTDFLQQEALLSQINAGAKTGDITSHFEVDELKAVFTLKK